MKKVALVLALIMMATSLGVFPVSAATAGEQGSFTWSDLNWSTTCGDGSSCSHGFIYIDDPYLHYDLDCAKDPDGVSHILQSESVSLSDTVNLEIYCSIQEFSEEWRFYIYYSKLRTALGFKDGRLLYEDASGNTLSVKVDIGNDFHCWRLEKRGSQMTIFMDSQKIVTYTLRSVSSTPGNCIQISGKTMNVTAPKITFGYIRYYNLYNRTGLKFDKTEYYEGDNVTMTATPAVGSPDSADFYLNNVKVGTGTSSNGYKCTISGLKPGTYNVTAKASGSSDAFPVDLIIKQKRTATLSAPETVIYGGSAALSTALSDSDIRGIDYYVNGKLVQTTTATSYSASNLPIGTNTAYADVFYSDGTVLRTNMSYINVAATGVSNGLSLKIGQEYELSYSVTGNSRVNLNDGVFGLSLTHTASQLSYSTSEGTTKSVSTGTGKFKVVVSSGVAEVYYNGQFLVSFSMPLNSSAASIQYTGISDVSITGNGTKATVYSRSIGSETTVFDENINMGLYYSLEFDKKDTSSETIHLFDGEFELLMEFNNGIYATTQKDPDSIIKKIKIANSLKAGYYRVTVYRGLVQIFVNNEFVGSFIAPRNSHKTEITRTMSIGTSTMMAIKNTDDIYYFEDDFAGGKVLDWSEYWYCPTDIADSTSDKIVTDALDNGALKLSGKGGTYVLDAIADNFTFKASVSSVPSSFSVALKYRDEYNTIKLTYSSNYWNLYEVKKGTSTRVTRTRTSTKTGDYVITVKDDKLTFKIGSTTIFDNVALSYGGNGKIGFMLPSAFLSSTTYSMTVDNVSYVGNGKVNSGVNYNLWEGFNTIETWPDSNGNAVVRGGYNLYTTSDLGKTWNTPVYAELGTTAITLQSGQFLTVGYGGDHHTATLYASPEAAAAAPDTFVAQRQIQKSGDKIKADVLHGRLMQAEDGRIYYAISTGSEIYGKIQVYYSDNEGRSWTYSSAHLESNLLDGLMLHEPDMVELPNGTIRLYARTDSGFICYTDSYDRGVTFDTEFTMSQLISPTTCFAVDRDGYTDTYYAIFEYDVSTADMLTHQGPRNRFGLAVSYDGCKTWKYIMEMDDRGNEADLWHNNPNIRVVNGIVYASIGYYGAVVQDFMDVRSMTFVVDPSKVKTRDRFANAHYVIPDYPTVHDYYKNHVVLPKTTGTALIAGQSVPALANEDGFIIADVVADAFGATKVQTSTGVSLNIGGGSVAFAADGVNASLDGKFINVKKAIELFGKKLIETDTAYVITNTPINSVYISELDNLRLDTPRLVKDAIADFKNITSAATLKAFINDYQSIFGIDEDFSDETYENMYTTYKTVNLAKVNDYATLASEVDSLANPEKALIKLFLAELNAAAAAGDAKEIQKLLTDTYADLIPFEINTADIKKPMAIYEKMTGIEYYSLVEVENVFYAAFEAQKYVEEGKNNAVVLSSVSRYFDGWSVVRSNKSGGVQLTLGDENIAFLSANIGLSSADKGSVASAIDGYVYQAPGSFGTNVEKVGANVLVDSATGTVTFNNVDGSFTIKDASGKAAKSNTIITVFDITKPSGRITGTFCDGYYKSQIDFAADGTSYGRLPRELINSEKLTYRIERTLNSVNILVKDASAPDTNYYFIATAGLSALSSSTYWYVKFEGDEATATISNIGIYSALSDVKYDTSAYTLLEDYYYATGGSSGHTMQNLKNLVASSDSGVTVDSNGYLDMTPSSSNAVVEFKESSSTLSEFDRAEIDLTLSVDTDAKLNFYLADSTKYRIDNSNFGSTVLSTIATNYDGAWKTGDFYSIKFICTAAGRDPYGRREERLRPVTSMYVKGPNDDKWICLGSNITSAIGNGLDGVDEDARIGFSFSTAYSGKHVLIKELGIKTYKRTAGDYSYINSAVTMPMVDYNFSFDYLRLNDDSRPEFTIGGTDYQQTFIIEHGRVYAPDVTGSQVLTTIDPSTWYRFFGTVKMVPENKAAGTKNAITLYMVDTAGNVTKFADNMPMKKATGGNGIKFKLTSTKTAEIKLKNVRVYNGKALDIISGKTVSGKATVIADFLNDGVAMSDDAVILTSVYDNNVLSGAGIYDLTDDLAAYGTKRVTITDVGYDAQAVAPQIKIFTWRDLINLVPLTAPVIAE